MACADYKRHELLALRCAHPDGTQVQVNMDDGCSGRLCQDCFTGLDVKHWPGLASRIGGPERGLDALAMLRALRDPQE